MTTSQKTNAPKERRKFILIAGVTTVLIAASFGVQAIAESKPYQHARLYISSSDAPNPFVHKVGWGDHKYKGRKRFSTMSDAEIDKAVTRAVKHVAIEIDATADQEAKITTLLTALAKDMKPIRGTFITAGKEMRSLLLAPTIDRAALEKIRAERLDVADRASKELVSALADVADVLTLKQRKILEQRMEQFKSMRHRWNRG
ncbi:MAG: Spy/CpxP family protein refolding chaperone [Rhizobiaceae bacterium]